MPTLTQTHKDHLETLQEKLDAFKTAGNDLASAANTCRLDMVAVGTVAALKAGNAAGELCGRALELRGAIIAAHFVASNALLEYDPTSAPDIIINGPGGR